MHRKLRHGGILAAALCFASSSPAAILPQPSVTASSAAIASFPATAAVDNDRAEFRSSAGAATFLEFDFTTPQTIGGFVNVTTLSANTAISGSRLIFDTDGTAGFNAATDAVRTFTEVQTGALGKGFINRFPVVTARRVRWEVTSVVGTPSHVGTTEMVFMGVTGAEGPIQGTIVTSASTHFPSPAGRFVKENAVNGVVGVADTSDGIEYASNGAGLSTFLNLDLGTPKLISSFDLFDRIPNLDRTTGFQLVFSNNADFSSPIHTQSFTKTNWTYSSAITPPVTARYVRYTATAKAAGTTNNMGMAEIVFNSAYIGTNTGAIPSGGANRDILFTVAGQEGLVDDVTLEFTLSPAHPVMSDVRVTLISPDGTSHGVFGVNGPDTSDLGGPYTFNDDATTWLGAASALVGDVPVPAGRYKTEFTGGVTSLLSSFRDKAPNGVWTLRFSDLNSDANTGTVSSAKLALVTLPRLPVVTSPTLTGITATAATAGGNVTSNGGVTLSARGIVYSLTSANSNPVIGGTSVTAVPASGVATGVFTTSLTGLAPGSAYSYKAYATNSAGTGYTATGTFITPSTNADLASLTTTAGTIAPAFAAGTISYTVTVPNATTSVTVTPTVAQANATVKVNTVTVASGAASAPVSLNVGANTITTVVTAQDGTTTKTYTLTVTRSAAATAGAISWAAPGTFSNVPSQVLTNGIRHSAVCFVNADTTVNGVTFDRPLTASGGTTISFANSSPITVTSSFYQPSGTPAGSGSYGTLISRGNWHQNPAGAITIGNLTAGTTYQVQLFMPFWDLPFTTEFSTPGGSSVVLSSANTPSLPGVATGTFVATGPSITISYLRSPDWAGLAAVSVRQFGTTRVIDNFSAAYNSVTFGSLTELRTRTPGAQSATSQYGDTNSSSILGGNREIAVRDGHSGTQSSGLQAAATDTASGTLQCYGDASAGGVTLSYGSYVRAGFTSGTPAPLNLALRMDDQFSIDLSRLSDLVPSLGLAVLVKSDTAGQASGSLTATGAGRVTLSLANFSGMTPAIAADIDGIQIALTGRATSQPLGLHLDTISILSVAREPSARITRGAPAGMQVQLLDAAASTSYVLRRSTDLQAWSLLKVVTTDTAGSAIHLDTAPPAGKAFYQFKTAEFGPWTFFETVPNTGVNARLAVLQQTFPNKEWRIIFLSGSSNIEFRDVN